MFACDLAYSLHISCVPVEVHWNHGLCFARNLSLKIVRIYGVVTLLDINKDRFCTSRNHCICCSEEREGRKQNFVILAYSKRKQCSVQRSRARIDSNCVLRASKLA